MKRAARGTGVICVGDADRGDDAVGPACADILANHGVPVRVCAGGAFELLDLFRESEAIFLVDAVVTGKAPPGTVYSFSGEAAAVRSVEWTHATHGADVAEALRLARTLGVCPEKVCIYGVEASNFGWGEAMTPEVARALPALAARIEADWRAMAGSLGRGRSPSGAARYSARSASTGSIEVARKLGARQASNATRNRTPTAET